MFCGNCGAKNEENATFCHACGAPLTTTEKKVDGLGQITIRQKQTNIKAIFSIVAVVVVVALIGFWLFGGRSYEKTIDKYFDASMNGDVNAILDLLPPGMMEKAMEQQGYSDQDMEEFIAQAESELQSQISSLDTMMGENWKLDCEVLSDTDITGDELLDIQNVYNEYAVKVKAAKTVDVTVSIKFGEQERTQDMEMTVVKVGRSWYLDMDSLGSLL